MRIKLTLFVNPEKVAQARERWREFNGRADAILPGDDRALLVISVPDRDSAEGKALQKLAAELVPAEALNSQFVQAAVYDEDEIRKSELLHVEFGDLPSAISAQSPPARTTCTVCGAERMWSGETGQIVVTGKHLSKVDIFSSGYGLIVTSRVLDSLSGLRGLDARSARSPKGVGPFYVLLAASAIGYPIDGVVWSEPCSSCGVRQGQCTAPMIWGHDAYPRQAWDGSDFVRSETGLVLVSQAAWAILSALKWRTVEPGGWAHPIQLVDNVDPIR